MSWIGVLADWTPGGRRDTGSNRIATRESAANSTGVEWVVGGGPNLKSAIDVYNRPFKIGIEKKWGFAGQFDQLNSNMNYNPVFAN